MGETELLHAGRIVPVYPLTAGLTAIRLRAAIREALDKAGYAYPEYLPAEIVARRRSWCRSPGRSRRPTTRRRSRAATRPCAGSPSTSSSRSSSGWSRGAGSAAATPRRRSPIDDGRRTPRSASAIVEAIGARVGEPIELTVDQDVAIDAIRDDLARPTPMLRLLQGDVGSGKTAVAAYALAATARAGLQGALLAPTDLLARQHLETVERAARGRRASASRC